MMMNKTDNTRYAVLRMKRVSGIELCSTTEMKYRDSAEKNMVKKVWLYAMSFAVVCVLLFSWAFPIAKTIFLKRTPSKSPQ